MKKIYPAWFFTNEKLNNFLKNYVSKLNIKTIFGIGASGDFAFNLLALLKISKLDLCDIRETANITINFKKILFAKNNFAKILNIFSNLNYLKKTGLWYKYSFNQIKYKQDYILYLCSQEKYAFMQKQINKIKIYSGDFCEILKKSKNNYDLIYVSNILDSKKYIKNNYKCLEIIKQKLDKDGFLLVINQNNHKKLINFIESFGFKIYKQEINKSNIIKSFSKHYCYSFLLFKKK